MTMPAEFAGFLTSEQAVRKFLDFLERRDRVEPAAVVVLFLDQMFPSLENYAAQVFERAHAERLVVVSGSAGGRDLAAVRTRLKSLGIPGGKLVMPTISMMSKADIQGGIRSLQAEKVVLNMVLAVGIPFRAVRYRAALQRELPPDTCVLFCSPPENAYAFLPPEPEGVAPVSQDTRLAALLAEEIGEIERRLALREISPVSVPVDLSRLAALFRPIVRGSDGRRPSPKTLF